jgi:hypothetical protein
MSMPILLLYPVLKLSLYSLQPTVEHLSHRNAYSLGYDLELSVEVIRYSYLELLIFLAIDRHLN